MAADTGWCLASGAILSPPPPLQTSSCPLLNSQLFVAGALIPVGNIGYTNPKYQCMFLQKKKKKKKKKKKD